MSVSAIIKQAGSWLAALLLSIAAAGLVGELYLRNFVFDPQQYYVRTPGWRIIFRPSDAGSPGVSGDALFEVNSIGTRGDAIPAGASPLILAVGGSTTADYLLELNETWTHRVQTHMRSCGSKAWIGNMGKAGTNAFHHAMQLEKILPRLPTLDRIVILAGLNDMLYDFHIHHNEFAPENWDIDQAFMYSPARDPGWLDQFAIVGVVKKTWEHRSDLFSDTSSTVRVSEIGEYLAKNKKRRTEVAPEDFIHEIPDMSQALKRYEASLNRIIGAATKHGATPTFITQPSLWKENMSVDEISLLYAGGQGGESQWFQNPRTKWYSPVAMETMLSRYNDVMLKTCATENLLCIDLATQLEKSVDNYFDDFHFSETGAVNISEIVTSALIPNCLQTAR